MEQQARFKSVLEKPGQVDYHLVPGCVWTEQREKAVRAVLIGAGNVAWHIAPALEQAGVRWVQVLSRSEEHAHELASRLCSGPAYGSLDRIEQGGLDMSASLFVLAVKDEAIAPLVERLHAAGRLLANGTEDSATAWEEKTVVHVSGSVPMEVLNPLASHRAVMYFFQTFSKTVPCPDLASTPICIEASDPATAEWMEGLAKAVSGKVCFLNSQQRAVLHLGGVFACNYVNLMYTAAYDLFQEQGMDFSLLQPLMEETTRKVRNMPPAEIQTGPAVRGDEAVLARHGALLAESEAGKPYLEAYRLLARLIQERHER